MYKYYLADTDTMAQLGLAAADTSARRLAGLCKGSLSC